jgi:thiol-disulfide isomerase/thioredoxin
MSEQTTPEDQPPPSRRPWPERLVRVALIVLPVIVALSAGLAVWAHFRAGKGGTLDLAAVDVVSHPVRDQRPAPNFSLSPLAGPGTISLHQYAGRILVVNIWASWCGPCRREAPALQQVWSQYQKGQVSFLGIDHDDRRTDAASFAKEFGLTYPIAFDPKGDVARAFGAIGVPTTYVIAPNGWIAYSFLGRVQAPDLIRILNSMFPP